MIKAIIIDDEKLIREGLVTYIDWASLGIQICAVCGDGAGGIQAVVEHRPQIILADICLPDISGLDMFRQIRSCGLACQVIFISSYSEFKYAQQAVKLGAFDYLLKPIEADVLYDCVKRCANKVAAGKPAAGTEVDRALAERILYDALTNVPQADRTFLNLCRQLGISEAARPFLLVSVTGGLQPGGFQPGGLQPGGGQLDTLPGPFPCRITVPAYYQARMSELVNCICFFTESADTKAVKRKWPAGTILFHCTDPAVSLYTCLQQALCRLVLHTIPPQNTEDCFIPERGELAPRIIHSLDDAALKTALDQFFLFCHRNNWTLKHLDFQFECFKFLENIYKQLTYYYGLPLPASLDMHDFIDRLRRPNNIYDLYLALCHILTTAFAAIKKDSCQSPHTRKALAIIRGRYRESLTLKSVARELHVSASYLSAVFKEDTGCPFSDYLFSYRMNLAYTLVKEGAFRIYEVGEQVGYPDVAQFSKAFKKQFGVSPKQMKGNGMI